jgi:hypothetical protein
MGLKPKGLQLPTFQMGLFLSLGNFPSMRSKVNLEDFLNNPGASSQFLNALSLRDRSQRGQANWNQKLKNPKVIEWGLLYDWSRPTRFIQENTVASKRGVIVYRIYMNYSSYIYRISSSNRE